MKRKNTPLTWIIPGMISIAMTLAFIYLVPIKNRGERVSIPFPKSLIKNSPAPTKTPPVNAQPDPNQQKIYRWVDTNRKTHYGDKPPKNVDAQTVEDSNFSIVQFDKRRPQSSQQQARPQARTPQQKTTSASKNSQCESVKAQIEAIDERMRRGYTARTGEVLKEKRRQLVQQRNRYCH